MTDCDEQWTAFFLHLQNACVGQLSADFVEPFLPMFMKWLSTDGVQFHVSETVQIGFYKGWGEEYIRQLLLYGEGGSNIGISDYERVTNTRILSAGSTEPGYALHHPPVCGASYCPKYELLPGSTQRDRCEAFWSVESVAELLETLCKCSPVRWKPRYSDRDKIVSVCTTG